MTTPPGPHPLPGVLAAFSHRGFRLLWAGAFLSSIGTWTQDVALSWLIHTRFGDPFYLGLRSFAQEVPLLAFMLLGGAVADRVDRRKILLSSQTFQMTMALVLGLLYWLDRLGIAFGISSRVLVALMTARQSPVAAETAATNAPSTGPSEPSKIAPPADRTPAAAISTTTEYVSPTYVDFSGYAPYPYYPYYASFWYDDYWPNYWFGFGLGWGWGWYGIWASCYRLLLVRISLVWVWIRPWLLRVSSVQTALSWLPNRNRDRHWGKTRQHRNRRRSSSKSAQLAVAGA